MTVAVPAPEPRAPQSEAAPPVSLLLAVDAEYRARAGLGLLPVIAPRRFNPRRVAWLPVWHTEREGWRLTALFSNTLLAHQRGTTHSWVVLYYQKPGARGQCTVVTEWHGSLSGRRVVRGREFECSRHLASAAANDPGAFSVEQVETG